MAKQETNKPTTQPTVRPTRDPIQIKEDKSKIVKK